MFTKWMKKSFSILGLTCLLVALLLVFAPKQLVAQVLRPLDTMGGQMYGYIYYNNGQPTVSGTGTPTLQSGSSNTAGTVTAGSSATSVVITFANGGYNAIPFCQAQSETQLAAFSYTVSKTAITVTQTSTSGNLIVYECNPAQNGG